MTYTIKIRYAVHDPKRPERGETNVAVLGHARWGSDRTWDRIRSLIHDRHPGMVIEGWALLAANYRVKDLEHVELVKLDAKAATKTLVLPLKRKWFEAIKAGTKPLEFRLVNDYWTARLHGRQYETVVFTLGYPKKDDEARRIVAPYRGYEVTTVTSEEWGNVPQMVFAIKTPCHP